MKYQKRRLQLKYRYQFLKVSSFRSNVRPIILWFYWWKCFFRWRNILTSLITSDSFFFQRNSSSTSSRVNRIRKFPNRKTILCLLVCFIRYHFDFTRLNNLKKFRNTITIPLKQTCFCFGRTAFTTMVNGVEFEPMTPRSEVNALDGYWIFYNKEFISIVTKEPINELF